ncbi:MAG: glycoside hydrolase [Pseudomonadota bacterium]
MTAIAAWACSAALAGAETLRIEAGGVAYEANADTLELHARYAGRDVLVMPALLDAAENWRREGRTWRNAAGDTVSLSADGPDLSLTITKTAARETSWALPPMQAADWWIIPDGEGIAFAAGDPFWRNGGEGTATYHEEHCLSATSNLSLPAWSRIDGDVAVTHVLADGLQSELCLRDDNGVQGRLTHRFSPGAERIELLVHVGPANPLAPALEYRALLQRRGLFRSLADKAVPLLPRLYGAPQIYVWGDAHSVAFVDALHALGIERALLADDQRAVHTDFLARAHALGYLAGPYELFAAAVPPADSTEPYTNWGDLYPSGCERDKNGAIVQAYADRGCTLSSEVLRRQETAPNVASRYAQHQQEGADHVFVDVDAFGNFDEDFSPDHPMTMARDRDNRADRLRMGIEQFHFVLGSENVTAWSHGFAHYSHHTAQAHTNAVWHLLRERERFGGWWPQEAPGIFFHPFTPTEAEARALFGPADRVPLFEAAFHDSVIAADRWEFGLMKVVGMERERFAHALLYGTPTMWNLNMRELARQGAWLKAAHDDFRIAHGWNAPVALTGFAWLTPDHLVQQTNFADGRTIVANFGAAPWQGLAPDCVRVTRAGQAAVTLCPPPLPAPAR